MAVASCCLSGCATFWGAKKTGILVAPVHARPGAGVSTRAPQADAAQHTHMACHTPQRRRPAPQQAASSASSSAALPPDSDPMSAPTLIFPDTTFAWQKAPPKASLVAIGQDSTASRWALNWIEAIHWASFPLGFFLAGYVSVHGNVLGRLLGNDPWRLYFLVLGHLTQVFGGGITGNMMHKYEGWQVTPFRNPLTLPGQVGACKDKACVEAKAGETFISSYNNAWLRAVAYELLFSFQALGICLNTLAIVGVNAWTATLLAATVGVCLLGPRKPRLSLTWGGQPVSPLALSVFVVFVLNFAANVLPTINFYGPAIVAGWPPTVPHWGAIAGAAAYAALLGGWRWVPGGALVGAALYAVAHAIPASATGLLRALAIIAPLGIGAGGMIEGLIAESSFNQWWHWRAFVILVTGLGVYGVLYWHLVVA